MSSTGVLAVAIDWTNNGSFTDSTSKDVTPRVLASYRSEYPVTIARGRDQIRQLAPPMVGTASFELDNASKDYSPESTGGPLYGNLLPSRPVRIQMAYNSTTYNLFQGFVDGMPQHPEIEQRTVTFTCLGPLSKLRGQASGQKVSTQLYQSITTDVALGYVLDAVGWPAGQRVLDTGKTTLDWWWLDNEDAFAAAVALLNSEGPGAALYEDGAGNIVFESRHYRMLTARSTVSQATFSSTGEPTPSYPLAYDPRWKDVINVCTVEAHIRAAQTSTQIWALGQTVTLAPNEIRAYEAKGSDPFTAALTPSTSGADYTLTAGTLASVSLNRTSGGNCKVTLTAGANGATLTGLRLRAQPVITTNTVQISQTISSTASQAKYGTRSYNLAVRNEIAPLTLQDFTNAVVGYYQEPRGTIEVTLVGGSSTRLLQVLGRQVSDRVTVLETQTALNTPCMVERIEQSIDWGGLLPAAKFGLEKASQTKYFVLDTSTLDGSDLLGF